MSELRVIIAGAGGRMGRALVAAVLEAEGMGLAGALERSGSPLIGADAGTLAGTSPVGIAVADAATADLDGDVVIDFTAPASSVALARRAAGASLAHVIGTTGFSPEDEAAIAEAAQAETAQMLAQSGMADMVAEDPGWGRTTRRSPH